MSNPLSDEQFKNEVDSREYEDETLRALGETDDDDENDEDDLTDEELDEAEEIDDE